MSNIISNPTRPSQVIDLSYNTEGHVTDMRQREIRHNTFNEAWLSGYKPFETLRETEVNGRKVKLSLEETLLTNPDAANILRSDIRLLAFTAFNQMPRSFEGFTWFQESNKPQEEYLRDAAIGVLPISPSGAEAPIVGSTFEGGTTITNHQRRGIVRVLGDWIRFDQIGKVRQTAQEMGLSGRMTEEWAVYEHLTTTTNYSRNSTTSDNDVGANQQTLTWNADSLRQALDIIGTSKDRKSGAYLGYQADTLIIGHRLLIPALQLIRSGDLTRTHGATTAEAIGTGSSINPFAGLITRIIVSAWFGSSFQWALCDSRRNSFVFQTVEPFSVFQQTQNVTSEAWLHLDTIEYLVKGYFGVGLVDDRAWFYSDSTTDATVS